MEKLIKFWEVDMANKYEELGVDAGKKSVRKIFKGCVANDYPGAFVNIVNDPEYPDKAFTQHVDGDGSKILQRLLIFQETGNIEIVQGAVDDALEMNLGDISASGFVFGKIVINDIIDIRKIEKHIPKEEIMKQLVIRFNELFELYHKHGFNITYFLGGETADLPDQVNNMVFNVAVYARAQKEDIITGNVEFGDKIYGFASDGKAAWEKTFNSGIMANGLTLGRSSLMWKGYTDKYPFLWGKNPYVGNYKVGDQSMFIKELSVSDAIASPTRQWSIFIRILMEELKKRGISHMLHGISMNTGGGATKISHVGRGVLYKKKMPTPPGIFQLIQREAKVGWEEMFQDFNCGVGLDVVGKDCFEFEQALKDVSAKTKIKLFELGSCEPSLSGNGNKVVLNTPYGFFDNY